MKELIEEAQRYAKHRTSPLALFWNTTEAAIPIGHNYIVVIEVQPAKGTKGVGYPLDDYASYVFGQIARILRSWPNFSTQHNPENEPTSSLICENAGFEIRLEVLSARPDQQEPKDLRRFATWLFRQVAEVPFDRTDLFFVPPDKKIVTP
jgi:hypothetical protein